MLVATLLKGISTSRHFRSVTSSTAIFDLFDRRPETENRAAIAHFPHMPSGTARAALGAGTVPALIPLVAAVAAALAAT
jgi:hypothetical protein